MKFTARKARPTASMFCEKDLQELCGGSSSSQVQKRMLAVGVGSLESLNNLNVI
jgi:hypothetical protein